ncbi:MAG: DUF1028 domain-containing protein [Planctomycetota bacterium]|nr:DUF1028 domain-containing protein [Planctomycetota bacterium]
MSKYTLSLFVFLAFLGGCESSPDVLIDQISISTRRPVHTYSIVARDPETGDLGVAVQSHWFSVGSVVPWAEAGIGAVATQSFVNPAYGELGLNFMKLGTSAPDALRSIIEGDAGRDVRQVAMIDARGRVDAHTGIKCIDAAGHIVNESHQFSVQANLMENDQVWGAMEKAYLDSDGDLAERMLAALEAAQGVGGDIRGKQSAALLIVSANPTGQSWIDRKFDLRIEDHPEPIKELRRLVTLQRAYHHMNEGDLAMEHEDFSLALREYSAARELAPHIVEIPFWTAVTMASSGRVDECLPLFKEVFAKEPIWAELVPRLVKSGLLPDDDAMITRILKQAP